MNCPNCDKKWIVEIHWGYPAESKSIGEELEKKKIVLGGCLVTEHDPRWECDNCHHKWGEREE